MRRRLPPSLVQIALSLPAAAVTGAALALLALPAQAASCDELREQIEARIRGNGVADARVAVADAQAPRPDGVRLVGNCDGGARVLLYTRTGVPVAAGGASGAAKAGPVTAPAAAPPARPQRGEIVECERGGVVRPGPCR